MSITRKLALTTASTAMLVGVTAAPAAAAPGDTRQRGLVNVAVTDTTIQVPIAVAANICDVAVNVLSRQLRDGSAPCDAAADGQATRERDGNGKTRQRGLVNISLQDTTVQLPIAIAANVCDVSVNVLAQQLRDGAAACDAIADSDADA